MHILALLSGFGVGYVAYMHNKVGLAHLFQCGAEGGDEIMRQVGNESDRVGKNDAAARWQHQAAHGRIESGKNLILNGNIGPGEAVKQGRLAGIGITDQGDHRIGHTLARRAVQLACPHDALQVAFEAGNAFADLPPVGFDLGFAWAAEKTEATALPFQMCPRANQTAALIGKRRQLDLQLAFPRARAGTEYFKNKRRAIDHLAIPGALEIALMCDMRICGEGSRFGVPINRLGLVMAYPEVEALVELVGRSVALEILYEARVFDAAEAKDKGLVNRVVADDAVEDEAYATARRIADGAPLVNRWHKAFANRLAKGTGPANPLTADEQAEGFACFDTEDFQTGFKAFLDKQKPEFKGK